MTTSSAARGLTVADLAAQAWQAIQAISRDPAAVQTEHQVMHETGLTGGPLRALRFLPLDEPMPMRQLSAAMGCDHSYVTSLVDTLERRGLARREPHPTDRRIKVIVLTPAGQAAAGRVQRARATPPPAFTALSQAEAVALCGLLRKLDPGT